MRSISPPWPAAVSAAISFAKRSSPRRARRRPSRARPRGAGSSPRGTGGRTPARSRPRAPRAARPRASRRYRRRGRGPHRRRARAGPARVLRALGHGEAAGLQPRRERVHLGALRGGDPLRERPHGVGPGAVGCERGDLERLEVVLDHARDERGVGLVPRALVGRPRVVVGGDGRRVLPGRPGCTTTLDGVEVGCGSGVHAASPSTDPSARPVAATPQVRARVTVRGAVLRLGKICTYPVPSV